MPRDSGRITGEKSVKIGALAEIFDGENRVAMTPDSAVQLQKLGHVCCVQAGAGLKAGFPDDAYKAAGVEVLKTAKAVVEAAAEAMAGDFAPMSDMRASSGYRMLTAQNLMRRYFHDLNGTPVSVLEVTP